MTSTQSDVVFGNPKPTTSAPGTAVPPGFLPTGPGLGVAFPPPLSFYNPRPGNFPTQQPLPVRSDLCPGPGLNASAPEAATTAVQGTPKPGFYFWQVLRSEDLGNDIKTQQAKYTNYEIRNVSAVTTTPNPQGNPTSTFTYDQVAPIGKGHTITYTYQVKQDTPGTNVSTGNVGKPTRVSAPDAGVAIAKEVERDANGKIVGSFSPSTPVLILPLPIAAGATFTGTGTDPTTGGSLTVQGTVMGPDRVAGCSHYVQGYRVDATVTSSATSGQAGPTVNETFTIETQRGALLIGTVQTPTDGKVTYSSIVGENSPTTKPRSIPKELQP